MIKRWLVVSVFVVAVVVSASRLSSAQDAPLRPIRDLDTSQLSIDRAPEAVAHNGQQSQAIPAAPQSLTGVADWSKLTYQSYIGSWDIFAANGDGTNAVRLTSSGGPDITPRFNRGATRIAYVSNEPGNYEIYTINPNGSGKTRVTNHGANDYNPAWSPDGSKIVFNSYRDGQSEIYVMNANGTSPVRLTNNPAYEGQSAWSPDGAKIAFLSDRSGGSRIWVMNADGSGATQLTTQAYSEDAVWSPDGTQLAYDADADGDGWQELMIVNADGTNPHVIGDTNTTADMWARSWSPDGRSVAFTAIYYVYYQGNWYWTAAYSRALDTTNGSVIALGGSDTDWYPDWQTTDVLPPTSGMTALPATSASPFTVQWSGADAGPSGILGYDVQVKDGTGAWTTWLTRTAQTSANYPGIGGHTYAFRVRAVDNSSNFQAWPVNTQASTTVEALPPTSVLNPLPEYQRGELSVSWGGSDPGGSGIKSYDVQYRDGITGTWTSWLAGTTLTTANFNGTAGHAYSFRVRAIDRAQNVGEWVTLAANASTTIYVNQLSGQVYDSRHKSIIEASITITPVALNLVTSTASGYIGFLTSGGEYTVSATHKGYGFDTPLMAQVAGDLEAALGLPPLDDVIANGNLEEGSSTPTAWLPGGDMPPQLDTMAHDGHRGITLLAQNVPQAGWAESVGTTNSSSPDFVVDQAGNVHVVYADGGGIYYTRRDLTGTWTVPISLTTSGAVPAITSLPTGGIGVAWWDGVPNIYYRQMSSTGVWFDTETIFGPAWSVDLAADQSGGIHFTFITYNPYFLGRYVVAYLHRQPDGVLSGVSTGLDASDPHIALNTSGRPMIVIGNWAQQGQVGYCSFDNLDGVLGCGGTDYGYGGRITSGPDNLWYLIWTNYLGGRYATMQGDQWSDQWVTFETIPNYSGSGDLAVDNDGNVFVASADAQAVYFQVKPRGKRWFPPRVITNTGSSTPAIAVDLHNHMHVIYKPSITSTIEYRPIITPLTGTITSKLSQPITLPLDLYRPTLTFWYQSEQTAVDTPGFFVTLEDGGTSTRIFTGTSTTAWTQGWVDVSSWAGQTVTLTFNAEAEQTLSLADVNLDEVSLGSWLTPDPQTITPSHIEVPTSQVITITGDNFITTPQVRLNDVPLADVTWINTTTLTATVPALSFGRYDLIVTNPGGQASGLPRALLVGYEVLLPIVRK